MQQNELVVLNMLEILSEDGNVKNLHNYRFSNKLNNDIFNEYFDRIVYKLVKNKNFDLLYNASKKGALEYVKMFVDKNTIPNYLCIALEISVIHNRRDISKFLDNILELPATSDVIKLYKAIQIKDFKTVKQLMSFVNINHPKYNSTRILSACFREDRETFEFIIDCGADVNHIGGWLTAHEIFTFADIDQFNSWPERYFLNMYNCKKGSELGFTSEQVDRLIEYIEPIPF